MSSNFNFLRNEWASLHDMMLKAEARISGEPISSAAYCRMAVEEAIHRMYEFEQIELPYNTDLFNLLKEREIEQLIPYELRSGVHYTRKLGNSALHYSPKKVSSGEALVGVKYTYSFLKWFANAYSEVQPDLPGVFDESLLPKVGSEQRKLVQLKAEHERVQKELKAQIDALKQANELALDEAKESQQAFMVYLDKQEEKREAIELQRQARAVPIPSEFSEAETRQHLIDIDLKEAGWHQLRMGRELEYPVQGMPKTTDNPNGNGFVDYVLWDDNGKPLALIEAKRTSAEPEAGKHQACLYANCLEQMHGQRPVIFYSNGYTTRLWDDLFYSAPRRVYGFYAKSELQWLMQQRSARSDVRSARVNQDIAGRPYQLEAIKRVSESLLAKSEGLRGDKRNALLVMATGSGKTRTAAALVDVLFKHNWIKRVLFLADRNALVTQAKNNFSEYLPELSSIDLTAEKENNTTRLVFSTYPTMMNLIDKVHSEEGRFYGVGHFDLIIIDEAHRSVYNKYGAIFEYFDSLIVGLTATPKDSIDHNTYELFDCPSGDPTFSFGLDEAVPKYLVPYRNINVSTQFLRNGIKYNELSEEDQAKYEEEFRDNDTGIFPEEIASSELNKWLFNIDTVNKVLDTLMNDGLKIEGGDKIGRTIIFAVNQNHARFIEECFQKRFPQYPSGFISMIHNKVSHAQSLIEAFCDHYKENLPQIAISVDMMDTGVDAPRVLNLVFFKPVRSYAKFWQMIGRGTRLCPDAFGPEMAKEEFLIFDVCQNFDFFEVQENGRETTVVKTLSQQTFEARLYLSKMLKESNEEEHLELANINIDKLHHLVKELDKNRFEVKMHLEFVDLYAIRSKWDDLNSDDVHLIESHLSFLPEPEAEHENTRRFELMMLKMQQAHLLKLNAYRNYSEKLTNLAERLQKKYTIPEVRAAKPLIDKMAHSDFYNELTQRKLEEIRQEIRGLVKYLEAKEILPVYINIQDTSVVSEPGPSLTSSGSYLKYKDRVERYIRENKDQLVIHKIIHNEPITEEELNQLEIILFDGQERGTKEDFVREYGEGPLGAFIRQILGLDLNAANDAFSELLNTGSLRSDQVKFLRTLVDYLTKNGMIDKGMLFQPPFTDMHDQGLFGVFDDDAQATRVISIIDSINKNADVG